MFEEAASILHFQQVEAVAPFEVRRHRLLLMIGLVAA